MDFLIIIALGALSLICVFAIVGNALIMLSVLFYRGMQTTANILLASLATADFLVSILVMPIALVDLAFSHHWQFGHISCRLWTSAHVMLCTASILNLCVIGFDRYFAITSPLRYKRIHTKRLVAWALLFMWSISFIICSLPWVVPAWHTPLYMFRCIYPPMLSYRVYFALGSFYIPLIFMLFVYMKIIRVIQCRLKLVGLLTASEYSSEVFTSLRLSEVQEVSSETSSAMVSNGRSLRSVRYSGSYESDNFSSCPVWRCLRSAFTLRFSKPTTSSPELVPQNTFTTEYNQKTSRSLPITDNDQADQLGRHCKPFRRKESIYSCPYLLPRRTNSATIEMRYQRARFCSYPMLSKNDVASARHLITTTLLAKERKAITTVCVVVSGFVICWMPFFTAHLIEPFCVSPVSTTGDHYPSDRAISSDNSFNLSTVAPKPASTYSCSIPAALLDIFQWLGYFNSLLNPLIYSFCNKDFRRCFKEILRCRCRSKASKQRISMRRLYQPR